MCRTLLLIPLLACDPGSSMRGIKPEAVDPASPGTVDEDEGEAGDDEREEEEEVEWPEVGTLPVELDALMGHLDVLQDIADANGGNRAAGTTGFDASVDYASAQLEAAGYAVSLFDFTITDEVELRPPALDVLSEGLSFEAGEDIATISRSGSADVTGPLIPVDLMLPPGPSANDSTSGCEAGDFFGFPEGGVALIQRGSCAFGDKATFAVAAGAVAVIIFNEGQVGREGLFPATLGGPFDADVPVLVATYETGAALAEIVEAAETDINVRVMADVDRVEMPTANLIAETPGVTEDVVVVGGHLDSVGLGPGINDNGSGAMLVLEMALVMAREELTPHNPIRWVLWGGEELGLRGSLAYVESLDDAEHSRILANLNFDMVASPNPAPFVYDGDGSHTSTAGPVGSGQIEAMFEDWLTAAGIEPLPTAFDGRSDYGPFIWSGIPAGGLFTGAEQEKTPGEMAQYGGDAGIAYDACYHQACDTVENVDTGIYIEMAQAAGHAVLSLANLEGGFSLAGPPAAEMTVPMATSLGGCHSHLESPEFK